VRRTRSCKVWDTISATVPELAESFGVPGCNVPEQWAAFGKLPLFNEPGTQYCYGTGIDVVGELICRITGGALDTAVYEPVLKPCEMTSTVVAGARGTSGGSGGSPQTPGQSF
jgi:CubicO group peptidase (beta-lactamase class C family)